MYRRDFTAPNVALQAGEVTTQDRCFSPPDKLSFSATRGAEVKWRGVVLR